MAAKAQSPEGEKILLRISKKTTTPQAKQTTSVQLHTAGKMGGKAGGVVSMASPMGPRRPATLGDVELRLETVGNVATSTLRRNASSPASAIGARRLGTRNHCMGKKRGTAKAALACVDGD